VVELAKRYVELGFKIIATKERRGFCRQGWALLSIPCSR
jgi:hypothetical protein